MTTQHTLETLDPVDALDAPADPVTDTHHADHPAAPDTTGRGGVARRLPSAAGWLLIAVAAVLLWPAQWGGLTGLTVVSGHSMEPTFHTGDLVVTWRASGYEVGDIVSYTVPADQAGAGGRVIHRVSSVELVDGETVYTTRGDNNPADDPWTLTSADVTGTVLVHVPGVGALVGTSLLPLIAAGALGGVVTVLLWPTRPEDDEPAADGEPTDTDGEPTA
ncbi:MAG TPA: signal peptidase I [Micrococcales bacterium]|uniref:signal peptidase I n=1 Tax=Miniimonas arenae TaxID=676201 RepID=UPI000EECB289|nr:signal peptidase I [Miniimonas arenae]HCX85513.1 signal peptidase I [Micrococcales bacterium]